MVAMLVQTAAFSMAKAKIPRLLSLGSVSPAAATARQISAPTSLHYSLSPALLVRGGDAVLKNFYGDALGYFGGIRIPATFLAGSSLAAIFSLKDKDLSSKSKLSNLEKIAIKMYHLLSVMAFVLSVNTIVSATVAHTSVLHGRFDPMAETAYMMMVREFLYEFISTRWSFLVSMFCFLGMVTNRILIEFDLLSPDRGGEKRKDVAMAVVCSLGALVAHLLSFVNQRLWCWKDLVGMTATYFGMILERAFGQKKPLQIVSVLSALASVYYLAKVQFGKVDSVLDEPDEVPQVLRHVD